MGAPRRRFRSRCSRTFRFRFASVDAALTPLREKRIPFSAAFVLDTSLTMTGGPFAAARAAAESFITRKLPRSEVALFGFSAKPYVIRGWRADTTGLDRSLKALHTSYGTAVWDSVILASRQLQNRHGSARALVVLTDGRGTRPRPPYRRRSQQPDGQGSACTS
jgi:Mg-chelatase subunit ChlD